MLAETCMSRVGRFLPARLFVLRSSVLFFFFLPSLAPFLAQVPCYEVMLCTCYSKATRSTLLLGMKPDSFSLRLGPKRVHDKCRGPPCHGGLL
ncbi:hypothetical protein BDY21DRAFT_347936 [Lineolata rhizophorae]|uniref:Uncharacterized protein n=1 Tax=Lineolata rhizophorae TaxID=578093 RepID=A0A6A6NXX7_9PEZI|nr:hypothetical protein BDY21DRAFT_347936 [Lineolata rhizophorae]